MNWDGFYSWNIKQSRYGFLLQWKRSNKLSRGHISLPYSGGYHLLLHQIFLIYVTLVGNGMMFTRFINQYWPQTYLHLNLSKNSASVSARLDAMLVDADVTNNVLFLSLCSDNSAFLNIIWLCRSKHRIVLV